MPCLVDTCQRSLVRALHLLAQGIHSASLLGIFLPPSLAESACLYRFMRHRALLLGIVHRVFGSVCTERSQYQ